MQFWEYQKKARALSLRLIVVYIVCVVAFSLLAAYMIEFAWKQYDIYTASYRVVTQIRQQPIFGQRFIFILLTFMFVVLFTSLLAPIQSSSEGRSVAERLGGRLLMPQTRNKREKRLLNIVEEMAIASGLPVPPVYILDDPSINAFAAGAEQNNSVIGVTTGALEYLDRNELQAVVAHEFSHIYNGDVRLGMRLAQLIFGLMFMIELGRGIVSLFKPGGGSGISGRSSGSSKSSGSKSYRSSGGGSKGGGGSSRGGGGAGAVILLILAIIAICVIFGLISKIFGLLTQSAVSRQREYLADASAVQFTRTAALASALKKIGGQGDTKLEKGSSMYSHFFFTSINNDWLSSHPPIARRIRRIDPAWDGTFTRIEGLPADESLSREEKFVAAYQLWSGFSPLSVTSKKPNQPGDQEQELLRGLELASHEPWDATCIVLALLLDPKKYQRKKQLEEEKNATKRRMIATYRDKLDKVHSRHYLPLIEKSVPALKTMSQDQFEEFRGEMLRYIKHDGGFSFREWIIFQAVENIVGAQFTEIEHTEPEKTHIDYAALHLAGALAISHSEQKRATELVESCLRIFNVKSVDLLQCANYEALNTCLEVLKAGPVKYKDKFLKTIHTLIWDDFQESEDEAMFMQLMCLCLDRPVPASPYDEAAQTAQR